MEEYLLLPTRVLTTILVHLLVHPIGDKTESLNGECTHVPLYQYRVNVDCTTSLTQNQAHSSVLKSSATHRLSFSFSFSPIHDTRHWTLDTGHWTHGHHSWID